MLNLATHCCKLESYVSITLTFESTPLCMITGIAKCVYLIGYTNLLLVSPPWIEKTAVFSILILQNSKNS